MTARRAPKPYRPSLLELMVRIDHPFRCAPNLCTCRFCATEDAK